MQVGIFRQHFNNILVFYLQHYSNIESKDFSLYSCGDRQTESFRLVHDSFFEKKFTSVVL